MADPSCSLTAHAKINPISDCGRCSVNARSSDRPRHLAGKRYRNQPPLESGEKIWLANTSFLPQSPDINGSSQKKKISHGESDATHRLMIALPA